MEGWRIKGKVNRLTSDCPECEPLMLTRMDGGRGEEERGRWMGGGSDGGRGEGGVMIGQDATTQSVYSC